MASTPNKNMPLTPDLEQALMEDVKKLAEKPKGLQKILDSLNDESADLAKLFEKSARGYLEDIERPEEREAMLKAIKVFIVDAMKGAKKAFEGKKNSLESKIAEPEKKYRQERAAVKKKIKADSQAVNELRTEIRETDLTLNALEVEEKVDEEIEKQVDKECSPNVELEKDKRKIKKLNRLLKILSGKAPAYIEKELKRQESEKARLEKEAKAEKVAPVKKIEAEAIDMEVKDVDAFTTVDDIIKAKQKWDAIVNRLGKEPQKGEDLYWKNSDGTLSEVSEEDEVVTGDRYWKFRDYIEGRQDLEDEIRDEILKIKLTAKGETPETLKEEQENQAEDLANKLLEDRAGLEQGETEKLLLFYALGVKDHREAYDKLKNIIILQIIPSPRKNKNIFEETKDDEGKPRDVSMKEFLASHEPYGEQMVSHSQELLMKLHKQYGGKDGLPADMAGFRDALIDIIKSRGGKKVGKIKPDMAKMIYTTFLVSKAPHIGEKELCSLLIALRDHPPYVFDIINEKGIGWKRSSSNKKINVLEDFCIDGVIYHELKSALGLGGREFNEYIIRIAPVYEKLRSIVMGFKVGTTGADMVKKINEEITSIKFKEGDLHLFYKLMMVPLWPDKVGHAFKHATYLEDEGSRRVPELRKIEGPDEVKEINIVFVNVEEKIRRIADRLADERLDQELKEIGPQGWTQLWRLDRIAAKWWKRNAAEGYRTRYREEYITRLKSDPKFRTELMQLNRAEVKPGWALGAKMSGRPPAEGQRQDMNAEMDAIAERFGMSWTQNDTESYLMQGQERDSMVDNLNDAALDTAVRDLCRLYADGTINDSEFQNRVRTQIIPMVQALGTPPNEEIISFLEETTNRGAVDINKMGLLDRMRAHRAGLIALDLNKLRINIKVGRAQNVDVKTQVKSLNWSDRLSRGLVERMQSNRFLGRFINPTTTAIMGFGLANIVTQFATGTLGRFGTLATVGLLAPATAPAVIAIATGCLVGGTFGLLRQNKETLRLKAMKERREALGARPQRADDTKGIGPLWGPRFERRMEINGGIYDKVPADILQNNINAATGYNGIRDQLATAIALNEISELGVAPGETERLDLIRYPGEMGIEAARGRLVQSISQGRRRMHGLAAGRDSASDLAIAVADARTRIINQVRASDRTFQRFKRWENFKALGVGAAIGGAISAGITAISNAFSHEVVTHGQKGLGAGLDKSQMNAALNKAGLPPAAVADIEKHLVIDPTTHRLDPASVAYIRNTYNIVVDGQATPGSVQHLIDSVRGGSKMSKIDLINELRTKGINTGALDPATKDFTAAEIISLNNQHVNLQRILTPGTAGGTPPAPGTLGSDWHNLKSIHFNDNQPHMPRSHILDELRGTLKGGRMAPGPDGNYHFAAPGMMDPSLPHSFLPAGIVMPKDPSHLIMRLEMKQGGNIFWKDIPYDTASQSFPVPPAFIDQARFAPIAHGGDTLPGLRTTAAAIGFDDHNGTFQVLASAKGEGGFVPGPIPTPGTIEFVAEISKDVQNPGAEIYTASQMFTQTEPYDVAAAAVIGFPEQHLEYGPGQQLPPPVQPKPPKKPRGKKPGQPRQPRTPRPPVVVPPRPQPPVGPGGSINIITNTNVTIGQINNITTNIINNINVNQQVVVNNITNQTIINNYITNVLNQNQNINLTNINVAVNVLMQFLVSNRNTMNTLYTGDPLLQATIDRMTDEDRANFTPGGINLLARLYLSLHANLGGFNRPFIEIRILIDLCIRLGVIPESERGMIFVGGGKGPEGGGGGGNPPGSDTGPGPDPIFESDRSAEFQAKSALGMREVQEERKRAAFQKASAAQFSKVKNKDIAPGKLLEEFGFPVDRMPNRKLLSDYIREEVTEDRKIIQERLKMVKAFMTYMNNKNLPEISKDDASLKEIIDQIPADAKKGPVNDKPGLNRAGLNVMARFYKQHQKEINGDSFDKNAFMEIRLLMKLSIELHWIDEDRLYGPMVKEKPAKPAEVTQPTEEAVEQNPPAQPVLTEEKGTPPEKESVPGMISERRIKKIKGLIVKMGLAEESADMETIKAVDDFLKKDHKEVTGKETEKLEILKLSLYYVINGIPLMVNAPKWPGYQYTKGRFSDDFVSDDSKSLKDKYGEGRFDELNQFYVGYHETYDKTIKIGSFEQNLEFMNDTLEIAATLKGKPLPPMPSAPATPAEAPVAEEQAGPVEAKKKILG